jgi:ubiquinone/menaquinone biosynthesis C-methylase UbiE
MTEAALTSSNHSSWPGSRAGSVARVTHIAKRLLENSAYFARTGYWHHSERVNPDFEDANFINHRKVYQFIAQCVRDRIVLDVGCGTGYGTALLAERAQYVTGIDYSRAAIRFAKRRYAKPDFIVMNAQDLRFPDASFDFVFSSENFEHLPDQAAHLAEVRRVLKQGGICFIATPNPEAFIGQKTSPWHTKENTYDELAELLRPVFSEFVILENSLTAKRNRGLVATDPLIIFGQRLDNTYLSNTHSFFCFAR